MTDEETRAATWRAEQLQMRRQRAAIERSLAGNRAARADLADDYDPIVQWLAERNTRDGDEEDSDVLAND